MFHVINDFYSLLLVLFTVVVVVAFFICWAPFQTQRLYALYFSPSGNTSPRTILIYKFITYASGLLYYLSTTINPFLYNIMSLKFREAFKVGEAIDGNNLIYLYNFLILKKITLFLVIQFNLQHFLVDSSSTPRKE